MPRWSRNTQFHECLEAKDKEKVADTAREKDSRTPRAADRGEKTLQSLRYSSVQLVRKT